MARALHRNSPGAREALQCGSYAGWREGGAGARGRPNRAPGHGKRRGRGAGRTRWPAAALGGGREAGQTEPRPSAGGKALRHARRGAHLRVGRRCAARGPASTRRAVQKWRSTTRPPSGGRPMAPARVRQALLTEEGCLSHAALRSATAGSGTGMRAAGPPGVAHARAGRRMSPVPPRPPSDQRSTILRAYARGRPARRCVSARRPANEPRSATPALRSTTDRSCVLTPGGRLPGARVDVPAGKGGRDAPRRPSVRPPRTGTATPGLSPPAVARRPAGR